MLPTYRDLIYPTLAAVEGLGGSAQAREITAQVLADIGATDAQVELTYENRPKSVLVDRIDWARSYATLGGALDRPRRGLFLMTPLGKEILALSESNARKRIDQMDREIRSARRKSGRAAQTGQGEVETETEEAVADEVEGESAWKDVLLRRLHRLTPDGFEEFVIYLLKSFDMELSRVGGSGDEGC